MRLGRGQVCDCGVCRLCQYRMVQATRRRKIKAADTREPWTEARDTRADELRYQELLRRYGHLMQNGSAY